MGRGVGSLWVPVELHEGMTIGELRAQLAKLPDWGELANPATWTFFGISNRCRMAVKVNSGASEDAEPFSERDISQNLAWNMCRAIADAVTKNNTELALRLLSSYIEQKLRIEGFQEKEKQTCQ
jgi:hypothetical protein